MQTDKDNNYHIKIYQKLKNDYFLRPDGNNVDKIQKLIKTALISLIRHQGTTPVYPITTGIPSVSKIIKESNVPLKFEINPSRILAKLHTLVQGSVKAGHPYMVKNLIPTASIPALVTYLSVSLYMPNAVTGEDAAQVLLAEIACTSAISKLVGIDSEKSGGIFTFGGTATNLYALKIGLSKVYPKHGFEGFKNDVVTIESKPAHYCHKTAANWLGMGQNNSISVGSYPDQTTKLDELEKKCYEVLKSGKKISCINTLGGTTSNLGMDDIKKVYEIREKLVKEFNLSYIPHIHVDSVSGWAFLNFKSYDFSKNSFHFKSKTIKQIKKILKKVKTFKYADSLGVDFHKTGYVAYNSSMFIVKNKTDLMKLERDGKIMTPLFHDKEAYNPGRFTLETSRSAANILAAWIALQTFGQEGYQALLGHAIEMGINIRENIENYINEGLYIANQEQYGPDVFIRCYPPGINPKKAYETEMHDDTMLSKNTKYISNFSNCVLKTMPYKNKGFAVSQSSAAIYTYTGAPMVAFRMYPLSPYINERTVKELVTRFVRAKKQFDKYYAG